MTPRVVTLPELKARLSSLIARDEDARSFAIRGRAASLDGRTFEVDGRQFLVRDVASVIDLRVALQELELTDANMILLTDIDTSQLGQDVRARLARHQVIDRKPWELVLETLDVRRIDARLVDDPTLAEILIGRMPNEGWPAIPAGVLDAATAWRFVLRAALEYDRQQTPFDLQALMEWALDADNLSRWRQWPQELQPPVLRAVRELAGPVAASLMEALLDPQAASPLALGLVADCVGTGDADDGLDDDAQRLVGKLEDRLGLSVITHDQLDAWGQAAATVVRLDFHQDGGRPTVPRACREAAALLADMGVVGLAIRSRFISSALDLRVQDMAACLHRVLEEPSDNHVTALENSARRVNRHLDSERTPERRARTTMMVRLARWWRRATQKQMDEPASFADVVERYRAEGGFIDWARSALWRAESHSELSAALRRLDAKVRELREEQNRQFGRLLVRWHDRGGSDPRLLPIENVIDSVVAPLAKQGGVLLVVVDGMSMAVYRELLPDLARGGWEELVAEPQEHRWGVVAALPSVTEVSRASLLSGRVTTGDRHAEREAFEKHPALVEASLGTKGPRLFHKTELSRWSEQGKGSEVFSAVRDPKQRVVAVVLNDVDDRLGKSEPSEVAWTCHSINPLAELLEVAGQTGRAVVLTSDHGHVLEHEMEKAANAAGERFRAGTKVPAAYEIRLEGYRVREESAVLPWSERFRYGMKKHGYHGGASPQEVVVPLGVFVGDGSIPEGWQPAVAEIPAWWEEDGAVELPKPKPVKKTKKRVRKPPPRQVPLFPTASSSEPRTESAESAAPSWVQKLLESPTYQEQKLQAGPVAPSPERVTQLLTALEARGGRLTRAAVLNTLSIPTMRLRGFLSGLQRILNVDGYAVLSVESDSDEVTLNKELLATQFDIEVKG